MDAMCNINGHLKIPLVNSDSQNLFHLAADLSRGQTLIFAQGMYLVQRGVMQEDRGRQLIVVPHQIVVGVDYDCRDEKVFWTDVSGHAIRSANVNSSRSNVTMLFDHGDDNMKIYTGFVRLELKDCCL